MTHEITAEPESREWEAQVLADPRAERAKVLMATTTDLRSRLGHGHAYGWIEYAAMKAAVLGMDYTQPGRPDPLVDRIVTQYIKAQYRDAYKDRIRSLAASAQSALDEEG